MKIGDDPIEGPTNPPNPTNCCDALSDALDAESGERLAGDQAEATLRDDAIEAAVADEAAARATAVTNEATARAAADTAEATARADGDAAVGTSVTAETSARIQGDADEATARMAAVTAEADARSDADIALQAAITAEAAARGTAIDDEAGARQDGDAALASAIVNEADRAVGVEGVLATAITTETTNRTTAVAAEATARGAADTAEATTRAAADTALNTAIGNEVTRASAAEAALSGRIDTLATSAALPTVVVPQLKALPVVLMGHSLTLNLAPWLTTGVHFLERIQAVSSLASATFRGVGGSHMEQTVNLITGAGGSRWNPGATKTLLAVLGTINSAGTYYTDEAASVASIQQAAYHLAVTAITDAYDFTNAAWSVSVGGGVGWTVQGFADGRPSATYPAGATLYTANDPAWAQFTVPAGIANKYVWIEVLVFAAGTAVPSAQIQRNGVTVFNAPVGSTDLTAGAYSKRMIPVGVCSTGDVIRLDKVGATGIIWLLAATVQNDRNHTLFIGDHDNAEDGLGGGEFGRRVRLHNAAVFAAADAVNALVPNAASYFDLAGDTTHSTAMLWSGDGAHPNDQGQAWYGARISSKARTTLPWTARLHTV